MDSRAALATLREYVEAAGGTLAVQQDDARDALFALEQALLNLGVRKKANDDSPSQEMNQSALSPASERS